MIIELRVRDLGVIANADLLLDEGMTAITGETGAGKTMIVDALELLVGGRFDTDTVRYGATEASIEGSFFHQGCETTIQRILPKAGRSRALINGSLAPIGSLASLGSDLVDLHGQHAHQSLLSAVEQRRALDQFAGVGLDHLRTLQDEIRRVDLELQRHGGDELLRNRELELWQFELREIEDVEIVSSHEDEDLEAEQELLSQVISLRESATRAYDEIIGGEAQGARDLLGGAIESLGHHAVFNAFAGRLRSLSVELDDVSVELRRVFEGFEENPTRLEEIRERRSRISRLKKKHGDSLSAVLETRDALIARIDRARSLDEIHRQLMDERVILVERLRNEEERIGDLRRAAATHLAEAVESNLHILGLVMARIEIDLPEIGLADEVNFKFSSSPGEPALSLGKVASGGELSRAMLALRLVLSAGPSTLVFDEVDAGVGGEAALAVGRALRELGRNHQVIVVTHLAQVAAFADNQLVVVKELIGDRSIAHIEPAEGERRISELARMLSGHPDSEVARRHAAELLEVVRREPLPPR